MNNKKGNFSDANRDEKPLEKLSGESLDGARIEQWMQVADQVEKREMNMENLEKFSSLDQKRIDWWKEIANDKSRRVERS